jgi:hypothetical protein
LARSLAADRSTKFLPIVFSQLVFVALFFISFWKTESSELGPGNWIHIEAHSLAFSVLFLWLTPAIFLSAVIGVSQTELEIPRRLNEARQRLKELGWCVEQLPAEVEIPEVKYEAPATDHLKETSETATCTRSTSVQLHTTLSGPTIRVSSDSASTHGGEPQVLSERKTLDYKQRIRSGGMYHWRPELHRTTSLLERHLDVHRKWVFSITSFVLVISAGVAGLWVSGLVPPSGFNARHVCELVIIFIWLINAALDSCFTRSLWYWFMFTKDVIATLGVIAMILATQIGILNRCDAWTNWGRSPLMLPQLEQNKVILQAQIEQTGIWPLITYAGITIQVLFCLGTAVLYIFAFRVYLQRDDGKSNIGESRVLHAVCRSLEWVSEKITRRLVDLHEGVQKEVELMRLVVDLPGPELRVNDGNGL